MRISVTRFGTHPSALRWGRGTNNSNRGGLWGWLRTVDLARGSPRSPEPRDAPQELVRILGQIAIESTRPTSRHDRRIPRRAGFPKGGHLNDV